MMTDLGTVYGQHEELIESVRQEHQKETLFGPLLMNLKAYYDQPIKLFIVGQETASWAESGAGQEALLDDYQRFNVGAAYRNTPFWSFARKLESLVGIEKYSCAWSNLNRYDHAGGEPKGEVLKSIEALDFLVVEEIKCIEPDICMFFTNHKYDYRLKRMFPGVEMEPIRGLREGHFVRLRHPALPEYSFRTPHPRTVRTQKWEEDFFKQMDQILPKVNPS